MRISGFGAGMADVYLCRAGLRRHGGVEGGPQQGRLVIQDHPDRCRLEEWFHPTLGREGVQEDRVLELADDLGGDPAAEVDPPGGQYLEGEVPRLRPVQGD